VDRKTAKVLVVEDEANAQESCQRILTNAGFSPTSTTSRTILTVDPAAFDVLLIDLESAGQTGLKLLDEIRERQPRIEVIGITADQTLEDAKAAVRYGASDFVFKPLSPATVTSAVSQALERTEWTIRPAQASAEEPQEESTACCWIEYEGGNQVTIGVERGFLRSIETPLYVELPQEGQRIVQGEAVARILTQDGVIHELPSPATGCILRVHEALLWDVDEIRQAGWAVRMGIERSAGHGK
jgi:DNA-binding response OmpR family regulator